MLTWREHLLPRQNQRHRSHPSPHPRPSQRHLRQRKPNDHRTSSAHCRHAAVHGCESRTCFTGHSQICPRTRGRFVQGWSGRKGRVLKEDITAFVKAKLSTCRLRTAPVAQGAMIHPSRLWTSASRPVESQSLSRIQRLSGPHLHRSWLNIPTSHTMTRPTSPS